MGKKKTMHELSNLIGLDLEPSYNDFSSHYSSSEDL